MLAQSAGTKVVASNVTAGSVQGIKVLDETDAKEIRQTNQQSVSVTSAVC